MKAPPFYAIGQKMDEPTIEGLRDGSIKPDRFTPIVYSWVQQRARDELRKWMRAVGRGRGHETEWLPSGTSRFDVMETDAEPTSVLSRILGMKHNPKAKRLRKLLRAISDENPRRADAEVFKEFLSIIEGMSAGETSVEFGRVDERGIPRGISGVIAERMGKSRQFAGQALKRSFEFLAERAQRKPQLKRLWEEIRDAEFGAGEMGRSASATEEFLADLQACGDEVMAACDADEHEADRTVTVGPLELTIGKFPGAGSGAYSK